MKRCAKCGKIFKVGDEVHVVDEFLFCSDECAIVHITNDIICNAKEVAKKQYNENVTIMTVRPTTEHATCDVCGKDLAECETIWAAEGSLYCSRKCGIQDYMLVKDSETQYAAELFSFVAEELNPKDIGIVGEDNEY